MCHWIQTDQHAVAIATDLEAGFEGVRCEADTDTHACVLTEGKPVSKKHYEHKMQMSVLGAALSRTRKWSDRVPLTTSAVLVYIPLVHTSTSRFFRLHGDITGRGRKPLLGSVSGARYG